MGIYVYLYKVRSMIDRGIYYNFNEEKYESKKNLDLFSIGNCFWD